MKGAASLPGLVSAPCIADWITPQSDGTLALRSGRAELGQGVLAAFIRIAAVELDLPPERIVIFGPDTDAAPDEGFTAGSLSMTQGGMAIRLVCSALRTLCLAEAGRRLNRAPGDLTISGGTILGGGGPTGLDIVAVAAGIALDTPVLEHAAPGADAVRSPLSVTDHRDLTDILTGAPFLHDLVPDGLLIGRVLHPRSATAPLAAPFDADGLRARPGVVDVVVDGRFIGLVADTETRAIAAAAWAQGRLSWHVPEPPETDVVRLLMSSDCATDRLVETGSALPQDPPGIDLTSRRDFLSHGSIGPSVAIAQWTDGRLDVWSHTQGVFPLRKALAQVFGLMPTQIRVRHVAGAGCYGHNGADDAALDAALLARQVPGRPVKVMWSREDDFRVAPLGAAMATRVRIWTGVDGRMKAMHVAVTSPPHSMRPASFGAPCLFSAQLLAAAIPMPEARDLPPERGGGAARNAQPIYAMPQVVVDRKLVTGLPWRTSSLRALGAHLNVYAIETAVEAAAMAAGADCFAYRHDHLDDDRARTVLRRLREMADPHIHRDEPQDWGIALARYKGSGAWAAVFAQIVLDEALTVSRICVAVDMGEVISPDGARNQIEGGVIQSLSWTLKERVALDGAAVGTATWADYPVLRFSEAPEVAVDIIDRPRETPLGCAEAVQGPTAAAVGNAVLRLTGCHMPHLPLRRESLLAALSA